MKNILCLIGLSFLITCQTIELPMQDGKGAANAPIFQLTGSIGFENIKLTVGQSNQVMLTKVEERPFRVVTLSGRMQDKNCITNDCPNSLALHLRRYDQATIRGTEIGKRVFYKKSNEVLTAKTISRSLFSNSNSSKLEYLWLLNNEKISTNENVVIESKNAQSTLCLNIKHPDGTKASQCQLLDFNLFDSLPGMKVTIATVQRDKIFGLKPLIIGGVMPYKIKWDNGSTEETIELDAIKDTYKCVTVIDARGREVSACGEFNVSGKIKAIADFSLAYEQNSLKEITQFNTVELIYIDSNSKTWASFLNAQPANSFFEILEDNEFEINDRQLPTRRIKIKFQSQLYNGRESLPISMEGYFAVAVPK